jgi:hypothetical protein
VVRHEIVERAILSAVSEVLDEKLLARALDKALDRLKAEGKQSQDRQPQIERDLRHLAALFSLLRWHRTPAHSPELVVPSWSVRPQPKHGLARPLIDHPRADRRGTPVGNTMPTPLAPRGTAP